MNFHLYFIFVTVGITMAAVPGPATLFAFSKSLQNGVQTTIFNALGLICGAAGYAILALLGSGSLLLSLPFATVTFKIAGSIYLAYLGWQQFKKSFSTNKRSISLQQISNKQEFLSGFIVSISNPNYLIFYFLMIPQFVDSDYAISFQIVILTLTQFTIDFVCVLLYAVVGYLLSLGLLKMNLKGVKSFNWINRLAGAILFTAAIIMFISSIK